MGYTHYWYKNRDFTNTEWAAVKTLARTFLEHLPDHSASAGGYYIEEKLELAFDYDAPDVPVAIDASQIRFNGLGDLGHETFVLLKQPSKFNFCKTTRKPYDFAVCGVLLIAQKQAPEVLNIHSDGGPDDWMPVRRHLQALFQESFYLPPAVTEEISQGA